MNPAVAMQTTEPSAVGISTSLVPESQHPVAEKVTRVAHYIYQKVVRRKPVPFQPSPKNPKYLLCYVEEELECGHKLTVSTSDPLTARTRSCHECSGWFGGLPLKKTAQSVKRAIERNSKGFASWWAIIFGGLCLGLLALVAVTHMPKVVIYQAPSSISPIGDTFQILQKGTDPNHWQMRRLHYEHNTLVSSLDFWTTTCDSVPLSPGETLTWLAYEDRGRCWSVSDKALGYTFLRDDKGNVILAPNCYWITNVLAECDGVPKF